MQWGFSGNDSENCFSPFWLVLTEEVNGEQESLYFLFILARTFNLSKIIFLPS